MVSSLSQADVFELVVEYLVTKGYTETEAVLKREVQQSPPREVNEKDLDVEKGSRLEDLLEK